MAIPEGARPPGTGDMFLFVKAATGAINGEAKDKAHKDEIEVLSWTWGMEQSRDSATGLASKRASIRSLRIIKRFDKASTGLMIALRHNDKIKEAVLTVRKAGGGKLEFLKIKFEDGAVVSYEVEAGDSLGGATIAEVVTFGFNKITVDYTPQGEDGQPLGGTSFEDSFQGGNK